MIYRTLGKTGLKVSQLGFGAMRFPMVGEGDAAKVDRAFSTPMLHRAFDAGVNYVDSAIGYCNQDSQVAVGDAIKSWKGPRESLVVSTKNHDYGEDEKTWWQHLENSLTRLQVSYIDVYHHHGTNWKSYQEKVEPRLSKWMRKAVAQGLVKHIACSFHDDNTALKNLVNSGYPEVITLQYNMLDRQLEEGIALAHEKGVGIVVMGPVAGGRLGVNSDVFAGMVPGVQRVPELALRFVLANPNVSVALSGMSSLQHVEENTATCSDGAALSPADQAAIEEHLARLKKMADLYCTGCNYCKPCPNKVDIQGVFWAVNMGKVYGFWEAAKGHYQWLTREGKSAEACVECGECEPKCPQHLEIRRQLAEAHKVLVG